MDLSKILFFATNSNADAAILKNNFVTWPKTHDLPEVNLNGRSKRALEKRCGFPVVPVHGGIPIVFISIHGVVTQLVNVSFFCVLVHEDTTKTAFA